jgi:hypothetical protein
MKGHEEKKTKTKKGNKEGKGKKSKPAKGQEQEDRFDFGGLPKRDLKKNLGCG